MRNPHVPHETIYQTGDLASVGAGGLFYCHGRKDFQVKMRGYRVEVEEIETLLRCHPVIADCCVGPEYASSPLWSTGGSRPVTFPQPKV